MPTDSESQEEIFSRLNSFAPPVSQSAIQSNLAEPVTSYFSRTVAGLDDQSNPQKPQKEVVCTSCIAGIWFTTPKEVKCFCQRMRTLSWQTLRPVPVTACDGWSDQLPESN